MRINLRLEWRYPIGNENIKQGGEGINTRPWIAPLSRRKTGEECERKKKKKVKRENVCIKNHKKNGNKNKVDIYDENQRQREKHLTNIKKRVCVVAPLLETLVTSHRRNRLWTTIRSAWNKKRFLFCFLYRWVGSFTLPQAPQLFIYFY